MSIEILFSTFFSGTVQFMTVARVRHFLPTSRNKCKRINDVQLKAKYNNDLQMRIWQSRTWENIMTLEQVIILNVDVDWFDRVYIVLGKKKKQEWKQPSMQLWTNTVQKMTEKWEKTLACPVRRHFNIKAY